MPSIASAYRGPLVIIGLGSGFSVVGAVPVAITLSIGTKTSATIIGMGFVGFGFLLILPGLFWCVMVRAHSFKIWRRRQRTSEEDEATPTLNCNVNGKTDVRERQWPPSDYNSAPPLLIPSSLSSPSHALGHPTTTTTTTTTTTNCSSDTLFVDADVSGVDPALLDHSGQLPAQEDPLHGKTADDDSDPATGSRSSVSESVAVKTASTPVEMSDEEDQSSLN